MRTLRAGAASRGFALALLVGLLAGCGSKTDPTAQNFAEALRADLARRGAVCQEISKPPVTFRRERNDGKPAPDSDEAIGPALAAVGLLQCQSREEGGRYYRWTEVSCAETPQAKPYLLSAEEAGRRMDGFPGERFLIREKAYLCWARWELADVLKWDGPASGMPDIPAQVAKVTYRRRLADVAPWARDPRVQAALPALAERLAKPEEETQQTLAQTREGWEVLR